MRAAGDQARTACGSLQLYVVIEVGIHRATHAVAQRCRERHNPEQGGPAGEGSEGAEDESAAATSRTEREGESERVAGIGEVPQLPRERSTVE